MPAFPSSENQTDAVLHGKAATTTSVSTPLNSLPALVREKGVQILRHESFGFWLWGLEPSMTEGRGVALLIWRSN